MNIIAWNVRGVRGSGMASAIRNLVLDRSPALMGLIETKHTSVDMQSIRAWWSKDNFSWEDILAYNGGGGLILIWDLSAFLKVDGKKGDRWICIKGRITEKNFLARVVLVYGPNDREGRKNLWVELMDLKQEIDAPIMVLGDFNEVLIPEERKGGTTMSASIREFSLWQSSMDLVELPLLSRKFTWYRNNSASRIDRAFVDTEWYDCFKELKL